MKVFHEPDEPDFGKDALTFALGAAGGLAVGLLLSRKTEAPRRVGRLGSDLRDRARSAARRLRPARRRRLAGEQAILTDLEDRVLDAFLADSILSERGIDVGAISAGIIELSGSVRTEEEADHAVHVANRIPGVDTVVNQLDLEDELRHFEEARQRFEDDDYDIDFQSQGRRVGMNRRRQGRETDPDRPDDSQIQKAEALRRADIEQWQDEGLAWEQPHMSERPEVQRADRTDYEEDELSNQDPHGKHGTRTLDEQPQATNPSARVGQGLKPGVELSLEEKDVPVKPHAGNFENEGEDHDVRQGS
jgi:hypothetical protein